MAQCSNCNNDVLWGETENGRKMALDLDPINPKDPKFAGGAAMWKLYVLMRGEVRRATPEDERLRRPLRTCHFDSCRSRR